jgi:hypothetical protein
LLSSGRSAAERHCEHGDSWNENVRKFCKFHFFALVGRGSDTPSAFAKASSFLRR